MKTNTTITNSPSSMASFLPCLAAILVMLTCAGTGTEPDYNDRNAIVMEAYLFVGQPVNHVRLRNLGKAVYDSMVAFPRWNNLDQKMDTIDTLVHWISDSHPSIDNALVTISAGGISHTLAFRDSGWYRDTSGKLVVAAGQTYRIDVFADSRHAWAETTVPSMVSNLQVSRETIITDTMRPQEYDPCGKEGCKDPDTGSNRPPVLLPDSIANLTIKWDNPNHYYLYYRCSFEKTQDGYDRYIGSFTDKDSLIVTTLRDTNDLNPHLLSYGAYEKGIRLPIPGRFKLVLYSTTPDYRELIEMNTDSIHEDKWIKVPNEIHGGVGVFTSFSISDSIFFNIVQTPQ